jgi:hypothetical protein
MTEGNSTEYRAGYLSTTCLEIYRYTNLVGREELAGGEGGGEEGGRRDEPAQTRLLHLVMSGVYVSCVNGTQKGALFTFYFSMCINLRLSVPYKERVSILLLSQSAFFKCVRQI